MITQFAKIAKIAKIPWFLVLMIPWFLNLKWQLQKESLTDWLTDRAICTDAIAFKYLPPREVNSQSRK